MARSRRTARARKNPLLPEERAALRGEPCPEGGNPFTHLMLDRKNLASVWERWSAVVLAEWIAESPGTRPVAWWWYAAPEAVQGASLRRSSVNRGCSGITISWTRTNAKLLRRWGY